MDLHFGIQVEPLPASSKSACFCSVPLSRRSPSRPMNYGSSPCRVTRGLLRQRARVVGALEKRINLSGSLSLDLFLSPSPRLFSSFYCQSVAHGEVIILTPSWPQSWTGGSYQHRIFCLLHHAINLSLRPKAFLAGKEDLMDLSADCPQRFQECLASMS